MVLVDGAATHEHTDHTMGIGENVITTRSAVRGCSVEHEIGGQHVKIRLNCLQLLADVEGRSPDSCKQRHLNEIRASGVHP